MKDAPLNWAETTIGELATYVSRGKSPKYAESSGLPVVNQKAIRWNGIQDDHLKFVHEDHWSSWAEERFIQVGDILWNSTGTGTLGRACLVHTKDVVPPKVVDSHVTIVRVDPRAIDPRFLLAWIRSPEIQASLKDLATGTTNQIELNRRTILEMRVPLAPMAQQKSIAAKLEALIARAELCRDRLERLPDILKKFRQSILSYATNGELTRLWREERQLDGEWPLVDLRSVASAFTYGSAAKSLKEGKVPVLRMGNIQDGVLDWHHLVFSSDDLEIAKYKLYDGDVLFNRTNSPELVGKTAVFRGERNAIFAGYLIRVRCGDSLIPEYLSYCLNSPAGRKYCRSVKSDGVSQSNINAQKLAAFCFRLPSREEQLEIVRHVEDLLALTATLEFRSSRALNLVDRVTSAALSKAFRGELVPQGSNDQDASELIRKLESGRPGVVAPALPRQTTKPPRKAPAMSLNYKDAVRAVILKLKSDRFSFEELHLHFGADYELLKQGLFELLEEPAPIVRQAFDVKARAMHLVRVKS